MTRRWPAAAAVVVLAFVGVSCTSGGSPSSSSAGACPVDALTKAKSPVTITFWHSQARANLDELKRQISEFESMQDKVRVKLVDQTGYRETFEKYKAGLSSGDLPDLGQFEETTVQQLLDSRSTVTMADCVAADHYRTSDFLPRALGYYTVDGKLRAMPWTVSNPVLLFDPGKFRAAGLDPAAPTGDLRRARGRLAPDRCERCRQARDGPARP